MKYVPDGDRDERLMEARFHQVKDLLRDILIELPASSVEIEKMHSNTLLDNKVSRQEAKMPSRCQMDTYTTAVSLEHEQLKTACEQKCLGKGRQRALRLLQTRLCDSSGPNNLGLNVRRKRKRKHLEAADDDHGEGRLAADDLERALGNKRLQTMLVLDLAKTHCDVFCCFPISAPCSGPGVVAAMARGRRWGLQRRAKSAPSMRSRLPSGTLSSQIIETLHVEGFCHGPSHFSSSLS